jgi:hypothetical protein
MDFFERRLQKNFQFIACRWVNLQHAANMIIKHIADATILNIAKEFYHLSSGRLDDVFHINVAYKGSFFTLTFPSDSCKMLMIFPYIYQGNCKIPIKDSHGELRRTFVRPDDVDLIQSFFNTHWRQLSPVHCLHDAKLSFIEKRSFVIRTCFTRIAMMFPGVILYNTFPYIICLPTGEYVDNFYFDVKHLCKDTQFTVSFEAGNAKNLKIVPFSNCKGYKRQLRHADKSVQKYYVDADDLPGICEIFLEFWA